MANMYSATVIFTKQIPNNMPHPKLTWFTGETTYLNLNLISMEIYGNLTNIQSQIGGSFNGMVGKFMKQMFFFNNKLNTMN